MSYTLTNFNDWKTAQKNTLSIAITNAITANQAPLVGWTDHTTAAINAVDALITNLTFTRTLTSTEIKKGLMAMFTYISIKYLSILDDPIIESNFAIPPVIAAGDFPADDFRNLLIDSKPLPNLDLTYFTFSITGEPPSASYLVEPGVTFTTLKTNLLTTWVDAELALWTNIGNNIKVEDKVLYLMLKKPVMKIIPVYEMLSPNDILLTTMHFCDAISSSPFKTDFVTLFPELA
jgi:hypothetical protein